ncbi:MAG: response regulator [Acidobacteriota bacterium]
MIQEHPNVTILVVDDDAKLRASFRRLLHLEGFDALMADGTEAAKRILDESDVSLVLCDICMPGESGLALLDWIRSHQPEVGVLMVTGVDDRDTAIEALRAGAYGYLIKPLAKDELMISVWNALERRRMTLISEQYRRELEEEVALRTHELRESQQELVIRLMEALECRDSGTGGHVERTGAFAAAVAAELGWLPTQIENIRLAAPLHDIGKIGVKDSILLKPGKLTPDEMEEVKRHAEYGARILNGSQVPVVRMARDIAQNHHERWDGKGYPNGLAGEAIPESARIVAVVDVYDALTSDRPYRARLSEEETLELMTAERGAHFDPRVFDAFLTIQPGFRDQLDPSSGRLASCGSELDNSDAVRVGRA